jgi:uncharacterized LabA/DUF88 family protein
MNSDHFTPDTPPAPEVAPEESGVSVPRRRRRARRATAQAPLEQAAAPELAVSSAPDEETIPAPPPRPRRRRAAPVAAPAAEVPEAGAVAEALDVAPEAEVPDMAPAVEAPDVAPAAAAPDVAPVVEAPEVAPEGPAMVTEGPAMVPGAPIGEVSAPSAEEALAAPGAAAGEVAEEGPPVRTGKRRRNRGRRGVAAEGAGEAGAPADVEAAPVTIQEADLAEPDLSTPEPEEALPLSPAVLRRFDHRNWRERPGRLGPTARAVAGPAPTPEPGTPVPFERRTERGPRYGARPRAAAETAPPSVATAQPAAAATPPPLAMPFTPAAPEGGTVEERLERLLATQTTLLQQQQHVLQSVVEVIATLQGSIERMSTMGIAAGMPRAGVFVDAPNVVYAAESARVTIDYGRMLDFLGRGRELVHAIVYAPVTEESGYRYEGQRFVAPFLGKGYKLVTKPLKRFPDGTAKGNFDIELAIDIVTMSQRLDVVILISGDSDFSRLIELIQSRGVRVEVVAFAANVSWELVQMADVFIDIGQCLDEFRPLVQ